MPSSSISGWPTPHLAREEYAWARRSFEQALGAGPRPRGRAGRPGRDAAQAGRPAGRHAGLRADSPARLPGRSRADAAGGPRAVPRGPRRARAPVLRPGRRRPIPTRPTPPPAWATRRTGWATTPGRSTGSAERSSWMPSYSEARIYLANLLYDRGETEAALHHLERTQPDDHFDELGIWRHIELKKTVYRLPDEDPELAPGSPGWARWPASPTDRHAARRGRGAAGRRRRPRSAPARAVRHPAERAPCDAEEAGAGRVAPRRHPRRPDRSGATGRRSCSR